MNRNRKASTKKIIRKRVLAGSMAVMVGAGLVGTYGYENYLTVQASESSVKAGQIGKNDVKQLEKAAEELLGDSTAKDCGGLYKDESVFVKADASGNVTKTIVTEWLKNPGKGNFEDISGLDDIKNIKGEETFSKGEQEILSWKSEGKDIYYQGTSKKKLPIDVKISYKLNGKEISPEDLKGKDGKVEIKIDYKNYSKQIVNVGRKRVEMYTPFTMVTALMLSTDEYTNVTIDNGKIVSDADKNIVLGVAFPGLTEDLGVEDLDIDLPESVTITADVKNATVNPTVTVASTEIMDQFDLSDVKDFDDLADSMDELENAAEQLVDGTKEAANGSKTLSDGAAELADGSRTLADGSKTLSDGVNTLNNKSGELIKGVNDLAEGVNKYTSGVCGLAEGSAGVAAGAKELDAGTAQMQTGIATAKDGADQLASGIQSASSQINGVVGEISTGLNQTAGALTGADKAVQGITATASLSNQEAIIQSAAESAAKAAVQAAGDVPQEVKDKISADTKTAVNNKLSAELGNSGNWSAKVIGKEVAAQYITGAQGGIKQIQSGIKEKSSILAKGMKDLSDGALMLQAGLGKGTSDNPGLTTAVGAIKSGIGNLADGAEALANGAATLNESSGLLNIGTKQLKDGGSQFVDGVGQLAKGAYGITDGAGALADGNKTLAGGALELSDGSLTLAEGMAQFKEEGINELTSLFDGDIQNVTDRLDAMTNLGQEYKSFAGIKSDMDGSTKFIIETDGID